MAYPGPDSHLRATNGGHHRLPLAGSQHQYGRIHRCCPGFTGPASGATDQCRDRQRRWRHHRIQFAGIPDRCRQLAGKGGWRVDGDADQRRCQQSFQGDFCLSPGVRLPVNGFFDNGGDHCYVMRADPAAGAAGLQDAILGLAPLNDLDLVAAPDIMTLRSGLGGPDKESIGRVQSALLAHCAELGNRLAILDALPGSAVSDVLDQREGLVSSQLEPVRGALYYPWLLTFSPRLVPPCGHVAGIFSRTDAKAGVFKAPANEEVLSVLDLETQIDNVVQDQLNPEGINCLRAFPGRGIRVWGARTISRDPNWRYVNVQRLFMTLRRWIDMNMGWAAFEPNEQHLWIRIQRELSAYLSRLLSAGALRGATAAEAFYVKCDTETIRRRCAMPVRWSSKLD